MPPVRWSRPCGPHRARGYVNDFKNLAGESARGEPIVKHILSCFVHARPSHEGPGGTLEVNAFPQGPGGIVDRRGGGGSPSRGGGTAGGAPPLARPVPAPKPEGPRARIT